MTTETAVIGAANILICALECFMLYIYFNAFYIPKHRPAITFSGYALFGLSMPAFSKLGNIYISFICTAALACLLLLLLYDGTAINKIISVGAYYAAMISAEAIVYFIFNAFSNRRPEEVALASLENLPLIIMVKIVQFCLLNILLRFRKEDARLPVRDFGVLLLVNIASMITTIVLMTVDQMSQSTRVGICILMGCVMMILNIFMFYYFQRSKKTAEIEKENDILESRLNVQSEGIADIENIQTSLRLLWHDINNHLESLQQLAGADPEQARSYMEDFRRALDKYSSLSLFGSDVVDAVLYSKYVKAQSEGISLEIELNISRELKIDSMDICCIFSNILDNAIEATRHLDDGKVIKLKGMQRYGLILISVVNPVKNEPLKDKNGSYITGKADKKGHGLGLKSVEAVADKYCGNVDLKYSGGFFYVNVFLSQQGMTYE